MVMLVCIPALHVLVLGTCTRLIGSGESGGGSRCKGNRQKRREQLHLLQF